MSRSFVSTMARAGADALWPRTPPLPSYRRTAFSTSLPPVLTRESRHGISCARVRTETRTFYLPLSPCQLCALSIECAGRGGLRHACTNTYTHTYTCAIGTLHGQGHATITCDAHTRNYKRTTHTSLSTNLHQHGVCPLLVACLLYTSPSPRDRQKSRMPSSA